MSQPQKEEQDKNKPVPRRSSLYQIALNEGIQVGGPGVDFFRNVARVSNGQQQMNMTRGSAAGYNSLNPTPLNYKSQRPEVPSTSWANQRGSSIPRAVNSSNQKPKNFMGPTNCSAAKSTSKSVTKSVGGGAGRGLTSSNRIGFGSSQRLASTQRNQAQGNPSGKLQPQPRKTIPRHPSAISARDRSVISRNTTLHTITRSSSMESISINSINSMMLTPALAYSTRAKSPGSMKRWGSAQDIHQLKTIKVSNDKKDLHNMMHYVHSFLFDQRYPNLPTSPVELKNISTSSYYNMVCFVGQFLVGNQFFQTNAKEDLLTRIVELATFLKYPSVLSKSHLKSANAQHAWPGSLTFLSWLCCRVQATLATEASSHPMVDFMKDSFPEVALQNYLNIFMFVHSPRNVDKSEEEKTMAMRDKTGEQLEEFRNKVSEMLMSEDNFTLEELQAQKEEKLSQYKILQEKPDPSKELREVLEDKRKKLLALQKKSLDTQEQIKTFRDINSLRVNAEGLKLEINSRKSEIESVRERLSAQPFNKQGEKEMLMEIQNLREQKKCLASILQKLESDLHYKQQAVSNLNERFRETIAQFTVVETFNANLSNLRVDGLSVPVNPLTPEELKDWLEEVETIHDKAEQVSQTLIEAVKCDNVKLEEIEKSTRDEMNVRLHDNENKRESIEDLVTRCEKNLFEFENEKSDLESRNAELKAVYDKQKEMVDKLEIQKENHEERLKILNAMFEKKTKGLEKWYQYVEELGDKFTLHQAQVVADTQEQITERLKILKTLREEKNTIHGHSNQSQQGSSKSSS